jgi:type II secretory pathway pseudopilin PulG
MTVALAQRSLERGATRFEFAVAMSVVAILATVLLQRINLYQLEAEQATVRQVLALLRGALIAKQGELHSRGKSDEIRNLIDRNPMDWLEPKPANYVGVRNGESTLSVAPGNWFFDSETRTLSYVLSNREQFLGTGAKRLNFKVKFNGTPSAMVPGAGGLTLEQTQN